jgi:hypothetical protein
MMNHHPDDGDSTHLSNVGPLQHDYTALHPRRLSKLHTCRHENLKSHMFFINLYLLGIMLLRNSYNVVSTCAVIDSCTALLRM